ncbi:hypothetical protein [Enterococcus faecalis]|nr:hypothetical protein [Enterococcus faecalis]
MNYSQKAVNLCKKYSSFSLKAVAGRDGILSNWVWSIYQMTEPQLNQE